mmetsp:Transcript_23153/g.59058  ORF Transcript_23153/g.59058 Transcript_23153/m.59058 type:complete len:279 (-) Transcript_23153:36-872(-)
MCDYVHARISVRAHRRWRNLSARALDANHDSHVHTHGHLRRIAGGAHWLWNAAVHSLGEVDRALRQPATEDQLLLRRVGCSPGRARDRLLRKEARSSEHGEAAVRELALLHLAELEWVLRRQIKWVKREVARVVIFLEQLALDVLTLVRVCPALLDADRLGDTNGERHAKPKRRRERRDLFNRRTSVAREERVPELLHQETGGRKHRHSTVGQLSLAELVDLVLALAVEQVGWVKFAGGSDGARQAVAELHRRSGSGHFRGWAANIERERGRRQGQHS